MTHRQMATNACFPFGFGFLCVNARFINEVLYYIHVHVESKKLHLFLVLVDENQHHSPFISLLIYNGTKHILASTLSKFIYP